MKIVQRTVIICFVFIVCSLYLLTRGGSAVYASVFNRWFQSWGGDVHTNFQLFSQPRNAVWGSGKSAAYNASKPCQEYFSLGDNPVVCPGYSAIAAPVIGDSGIISYWNVNTNHFDGVSETDPANFRISNQKHSTAKDYNYDFFRSLVGTSNWNSYTNSNLDQGSFGPLNAHNPLANDEDKEYYYETTGPLTIPTPPPPQLNVPAGKFVILVNGNLTINNEIRLTPNAFIAFIVKGDIIINPNIVNNDPNRLNSIQIEGVYIASQINTTTGGVIRTGTKCPAAPPGPPNSCTSNPGEHDGPIYLKGIFIAERNISFQRTLNPNTGGSPTNQNDSEPAEVFIYRPDFFYSAPSRIKQKMFSWQEVNP